jgi:hypothetical protein
MWFDDEDDCTLVLLCPACNHVDLEFDFLEYRRFQCSLCGAIVRIVRYEAFLRCEGRPDDYVTCIGEVESASPG